MKLAATPQHSALIKWKYNLEVSIQFDPTRMAPLKSFQACFDANQTDVARCLKGTFGEDIANVMLLLASKGIFICQPTPHVTTRPALAQPVCHRGVAHHALHIPRPLVQDGHQRFSFPQRRHLSHGLAAQCDAAGAGGMMHAGRRAWRAMRGTLCLGVLRGGYPCISSEFYASRLRCTPHVPFTLVPPGCVPPCRIGTVDVVGIYVLSTGKSLGRRSPIHATCGSGLQKYWRRTSTG
mmetsp:Transcript_25609/g.48488  ORF Transcript_25609/g.48488 Transcript_25609/m.48488 type:complete len:237 (+) Transcript_25609:150-860(+)